MVKRNINGIKQYNESVKAEKEKAVLKAIDVVRRSGKPFTLQAVIDESGVSRSYFTKHPELMEVVNKYRQPSGYKVKQSKDAKDTLIISLRAENVRLKRQLKAVDVNDNYKVKYDEAMAKIAELEQQLKQALETKLDLNF